MSVQPMERITIGALLRRAAQEHGDRLFLIDEEERSTFAEVDQAVDRLAAGLLAIGIGPGDHVGIWLPNGADWVRAFCACARIGAVVVPVNTRYKADEARDIIERSDAKALFMLPRKWKTDYHAMLAGMAPELLQQTDGDLRLEAFPVLRSIIAVGGEAPAGTRPIASLPSDDVEAVRRVEAGVTPDDLLLICFTSGTTGKPKGVMHNHGVIRQSTRVGEAMHVVPGDRVLAHMPFYHSAGLFMALIPALSLGAGLVLMQQWDPAQALRLIESERVSMFGGIPTHFYDLVDRPELPGTDTSSLKAAWIGGSAVMQETFERTMRALRLDRLLSTYGMTENTISTSFNAWDDPVEVCCRNTAPLLSDCEVRIVNPDTLSDVAPGKDGEIWCRGRTVMLGYYKDPEATAAVITPDGWLRTGDLAHFDAQGYLTLTGRLKEMLKVGGTNTSPIEIEQHLAAHPGVKSSVVVGAPDERLGQVAYAFIERASGSAVSEADIVQFCKSRMADYKVPRHIAFVDEFPRTATGKIQRAVLAKAAEESLRPDPAT